MSRLTAASLSLSVTLVAGALSTQPLATTAIWHPVAAPAEVCAPANATCLTLADGKILVAGGTHEGRPLASAKIYNLTASSWESVAPMQEPRAGHSATLLQDGRVLIAGGGARSLEIFDPISKTFTAVAGQLSAVRSRHAAALLSNGTVLFTGGWDGVVALDSADIYDPVTGSVTPAGFLTTARVDHTATTLLDGKVLLAGGEGLASTEVYDPELQSFSPASPMTTARAGHAAILLADNNQVLLAGGRAADGAALASAEIYNPWIGESAATGPMAIARANPLGRVATEGGVAIMDGGHERTGDAIRFPTLQSRSEANGTLVVEGKNWQPAKAVRLSANSPDGEWTAAPDITGSFRQELPEVTGAFTLTARNGSWHAQIVVKSSTTTTFLGYPQNPTYGSADVFSVKVAGGAIVPGGTVTLLESSSSIGSNTLASGQTVISLVLPLGTHSITASYGGDTTHSSSVSSPVVVTIGKDLPIVTVSSSPNPSVYGQPVPISATVSWTGTGSLVGSGPTGQVSFTASSAPLGVATLQNGTASVTPSGLLTLGVGQYSLAASYGGDTNYSAATSQNSLVQTVNKIFSNVSINAPSTAVYGQPITVSYIATAPPSVAIPQGNTTIYVDSAASGRAP